MLLGDGMGDSEITPARYYFAGAGGHLRMDELPCTGEQTTWSLKPGAGPSFLPDYVPDSATGTAWATGHKTIDERISQVPSTAVDVPGPNDGFTTALEVAQKAGLTTGDVPTAEITDATPAVLAAHISNRACQGPADARKASADGGCPEETKAAGGLGSIAEQMVDHEVDDSTRTVTQYAQAEKGYRLATDAGGLAGVNDIRTPVLWLFNASNIVARVERPDGPAPAGRRRLRPRRDVRAEQAAGERAEPRRHDDEGDLAARAARQAQGRQRVLPAGRGRVDRQARPRGEPVQQIGETVAFDKAIGVALDYQRSHPDTLVVLTADHGHTSQIVSEDTGGEHGPTGYAEDLLTKDGQKLRISYGTAGGLTRPSADTLSQQHTGAEVRIAAVGPQAASVNGVIDETDINGILRSFKQRDGPHG
jgi:alkaline phosphatase